MICTPDSAATIGLDVCCTMASSSIGSGRSRKPWVKIVTEKIVEALDEGEDGTREHRRHQQRQRHRAEGLERRRAEVGGRLLQRRIELLQPRHHGAHHHRHDEDRERHGLQLDRRADADERAREEHGDAEHDAGTMCGIST